MIYFLLHHHLISIALVESSISLPHGGFPSFFIFLAFKSYCFYFFIIIFFRAHEIDYLIFQIRQILGLILNENLDVKSVEQTSRLYNFTNKLEYKFCHKYFKTRKCA